MITPATARGFLARGRSRIDDNIHSFVAAAAVWAAHDMQFTFILALRTLVSLVGSFVVEHFAQGAGGTGNDTGRLQSQSLIDYIEFFAYHAGNYYSIIAARFLLGAMPTPLTGPHWAAVLLFLVISGAPLGGWLNSIFGPSDTPNHKPSNHSGKSKAHLHVPH